MYSRPLKSRRRSRHPSVKLSERTLNRRKKPPSRRSSRSQPRPKKSRRRRPEFLRRPPRSWRRRRRRPRSARFRCVRRVCCWRGASSLDRRSCTTVCRTYGDISPTSTPRWCRCATPGTRTTPTTRNGIVSSRRTSPARASSPADELPRRTAHLPAAGPPTSPAGNDSPSAHTKFSYDWLRDGCRLSMTKFQREFSLCYNAAAVFCLPQTSYLRKLGLATFWTEEKPCLYVV